MKYEVEQKFQVADAGQLVQRVAAAGGEFVAAIEQVDRYFAHPSRDFARTDEAMRIRSVGERNCVTYKGPKIDIVTKTRHEIEVGIADGAEAADEFAALLAALGFRAVATVRKERRRAEIVCDGTSIELALDNVAGVGTYVELETIAEVEQLDECRRVIADLAERLQLGTSEQRSYLELLLEEKP
jgi:adenylate cyclase class 2